MVFVTSASGFGGAFFKSTVGSFSFFMGPRSRNDDGTLRNLGLKNFGSGDGERSCNFFICI